jgi:mono/diheme cytochrome c family protein
VKRRPPRRAAAAAFALAGLVAGPSAGESPRILYVLHCQGCHLADGTGKPGEVPSLAGSVGRFLAVPGGRAYLVQVPGSAHSPLDDGQLAAVLNWMVAAFGPAEAAAGLVPYDAAEVARYRATPLVDVAGARAGLLRRLAAGGQSDASAPRSQSQGSRPLRAQ